MSPKNTCVLADAYIVVELTCMRHKHVALPDCSGIPKKGAPCMGPRVQNCHLLSPFSVTHKAWLGGKKGSMRSLFWVKQS